MQKERAAERCDIINVARMQKEVQANQLWSIDVNVEADLVGCVCVWSMQHPK